MFLGTPRRGMIARHNFLFIGSSRKFIFMYSRNLIVLGINTQLQALCPFSDQFDDLKTNNIYIRWPGPLIQLNYVHHPCNTKCNRLKVLFLAVLEVCEVCHCTWHWRGRQSFPICSQSAFVSHCDIVNCVQVLLHGLYCYMWCFHSWCQNVFQYRKSYESHLKKSNNQK